MKDVCCMDCEYLYTDTIFNINDDLEIHEYCQCGSVMMEIKDSDIQRDCPNFKPFIEDI